VRAFVHEHAWFLTFWSMVAALCVIEALWPAFNSNPDRVRRWSINFGLGILNGLILSLVPALTVFSAIWARDQSIGLLNLVVCPAWLAALVALLVRSFSQYAFHRCAHEFPLLWRVHRVHHCDVHLDASSALRFHPFEAIASVLFAIPFVVLFGLPPITLAAYETVQVVMNLLTHSNIRLPDRVERAARAIVMTPALHRFHHSSDCNECDRNYGDVVSFWDRLFGTFLPVAPGVRAPAKFGLDDVGPAVANDFDAQLTLPWSRQSRPV
jgi:sterol desaturase/sphingolipid hydroxylase (fatty acid hydroxylase superfamily)